MTYFCPALDPPLGGYGRNTLTHVRAMSIPTKFHKHPSNGSVVKAMTMCSHTVIYTNQNCSLATF